MKKCFKCERVLPLSEYYSHPATADRHLNKCKDCTKMDSEKRREEKMKDPEWVVAEAERQRKKQAKYREIGTACVLPLDKRREVHRKHAKKYPEKNSARMKLSNAVRDGKINPMPCEVCGNPTSEAHHDDYSKPLDVKWLCSKHHAERHVYLRDIERRKKATAA